MKIWANDLKEGTEIWYVYGMEFRFSKTIKLDYSTLMPKWVLENGDKIFINTYCYTDKNDLVEIVDRVIESWQTVIKEHKDRIEHHKNMIKIVEEGILNLEKFKKYEE